MSGKVKSGSLYYTPTSFLNYVRPEFASITNRTLIRLKLFLLSFRPEETETFHRLPIDVQEASLMICQ